MNILLTGCAGFIGFHTAKALCDKGNKVTGLDNLNTYYDVNLKYGRLEALAGIENFKFIKADLCDKEILDALFNEGNFDVVCNLAAQAGVRYSFENPRAYIDSNITGFGNLIEESKNHSISHFVYASSSSVYGKNRKIPFSESDILEGQVSLYAETKRRNEMEAERYNSEFGLKCTGMRFFTVYGPWGRPDMAPMIFAKSISEGTPIRVFNNGEMWRDFTYIDDIVRGVVKIIENSPSEKHENKIYNIGNGAPVYLPDFISTLESIIGKKALRIMAPMQKGDVIRTYADTSLIEKDFGYKPDTPLKTGLEKFWEWYSVFFKKS